MNQPSHDLELRRLLDQTSWAARLARTLVGPEGAEDLLQDAWVQTLTHPPAESIESPRAWLATLLRRGATRKRRTAERVADRERRAAREEALPSTHTLRAREEDRRILVEAILRLPESMREPLVLRYFDELSPNEIAARLEVPASTVRSRLQRGLGVLREQLEQDRGDDWRVWCLGFVPAGSSVATPKAIAGKVVLGVLGLAAAIVAILGLWPTDPATSLAAVNPKSHPEEAAESPAFRQAGDGRREAVAPASPPVNEPSAVPQDPRVFVVRGLCLEESKRPVAGVRVIAADLVGTPSAVSGADGRFVLPLVAPRPRTGPWPRELADQVIIGVGGGRVPLGLERAPPFPPATRWRDGATSLFFEGDGYRAKMRRVQLEAEREIEVGCVEGISSPRSVSGRVLTSAGLPAARASVFLLRDFAPGSDEEDLRFALPSSEVIHAGELGFLETDDDGRFLMRAAPAEPFRMGFFFNGHDGQVTESLGADAGQRIDLGDLPLEACDPKSSVSGRVVTGSGSPVSGAWIQSRSEWDGRRLMAVIVSGPDGSFSLPVRGWPTVELVAETSGGSASSKPVAVGTEDLTLVLLPAAVEKMAASKADPSPGLAGRILSDGRGVSGAWISSWKIDDGADGSVIARLVGTAQSRAEGRFTIAAPATGSCSLRARFGPWNEPRLAEWGPVLLGAEEDRPEVELELQSAGAIAGEIVGPATGTLVGTVVRARSEGKGDRLTTVGAANDFRFDALTPGRYRLSSDAAVHRGAGKTEDVVVLVESGATARARIELVELACSLVGRIALDGRPPGEGWMVSVSTEGNGPNIEWLDARGRYRLAPLEGGTRSWRTVRYSKGQFFQRELDLIAGENRHDLDLPTGRLELENLPIVEGNGSDGRSFTTCLTWEGPDGLTWCGIPLRAEEGALTMDQIPAGTVRLRHQGEPTLEYAEAPVIAELEIRAGATTKYRAR